jgi:YggT family protein
MRILCYLLTIYWVILFVRILSSWFPPPMSGPLRTIMRLLYDLTDPVLKPLRRIIPPVRAGAMAIDLSPIVVFVIIGVLQRVVCR